MSLSRAIAVLFLALGFALGSGAGVAAATEQAFADPCPMHQGGDCPCCKNDCTGAMMGCAAKCSVPFDSAALPSITKVTHVTDAKAFAPSSDVYAPFLIGPAPPIPIV